MSRNKTYYQIGKTLGLSKIEIKSLLNSSYKITKQSNLEAGPSIYSGEFYGTISIKDF